MRTNLLISPSYNDVQALNTLILCAQCNAAALRWPVSVCGEAQQNTDDLRGLVSWPRAHSWRVPSRTPPADWPPPLRSCHGVCCLPVTSGSPQGEVSDRQRHEDEDRNHQKTSQYGFFNNFYIRCPQVLSICLHPTAFFSHSEAELWSQSLNNSSSLFD